MELIKEDYELLSYVRDNDGITLRDLALHFSEKWNKEYSKLCANLSYQTQYFNFDCINREYPDYPVTLSYAGKLLLENKDENDLKERQRIKERKQDRRDTYVVPIITAIANTVVPAFIGAITALFVDHFGEIMATLSNLLRIIAENTSH